MKLLVVTNMYAGSNRASPWQGVFVTEQVDALRRSGLCTVDVLVIEGHRSKLEYLKTLYRIVVTVARGRYDIVHYHFGISACSAPLVRILTRARIVVTFHGTDVLGPRWMRGISRFVARSADRCIGVSAEIVARLGLPTSRCVTIPCAVDERFFCEQQTLKKRHGKARTVVFPSAPTRPEKNFPLFRQVVERLSTRYGLDVRVACIDGLDREAVRDLLARAHCLLMTSMREGSPQSVKEAMALNLPIVSVDVGDVRQLLEGVTHCAVVGHHDPDALAAAVADVLNRDARSNGRQKLQTLGFFSADVVAMLHRVYASLLDNGGPGARRRSSMKRARFEETVR